MVPSLFDWLVHAGDSACSIPPQTIPAECLEVVRDWTIKIAKELNVVGLINIQYCIQDNQVGSSHCCVHALPAACMQSTQLACVAEHTTPLLGTDVPFKATCVSIRRCNACCACHIPTQAANFQHQFTDPRLAKSCDMLVQSHVSGCCCSRHSSLQGHLAMLVNAQMLSIAIRANKRVSAVSMCKVPMHVVGLHH